jgi:hypothetical protein
VSINEIAKAHWDLALSWLEAADQAEDINNTIAYTGQAECALKMAQFAVDNPALVAGIDEFAPPMPSAPVPAGPSGGPKFWGAPGP